MLPGDRNPRRLTLVGQLFTALGWQAETQRPTRKHRRRYTVKELGTWRRMKKIRKAQRHMRKRVRRGW